MKKQQGINESQINTKTSPEAGNVKTPDMLLVNQKPLLPPNCAKKLATAALDFASWHSLSAPVTFTFQTKTMGPFKVIVNVVGLYSKSGVAGEVVLVWYFR